VCVCVFWFASVIGPVLFALYFYVGCFRLFWFCGTDSLVEDIVGRHLASSSSQTDCPVNPTKDIKLKGSHGRIPKLKTNG
jgi:hypothetical protein